MSIAWFTGAGASSAHATYDGIQGWRRLAAGTSEGFDAGGDAAPAVPTGVAVFPADTAIRSLMEPVAHWSELDRGGHFPAMEAPDLLTADIRTFFAGLRQRSS